MSTMNDSFIEEHSPSSLGDFLEEGRDFGISFMNPTLKSILAVYCNPFPLAWAPLACFAIEVASKDPPFQAL